MQPYTITVFKVEFPINLFYLYFAKIKIFQLVALNCHS